HRSAWVTRVVERLIPHPDATSSNAWRDGSRRGVPRWGTRRPFAAVATCVNISPTPSLDGAGNAWRLRFDSRRDTHDGNRHRRCLAQCIGGGTGVAVAVEL